MYGHVISRARRVAPPRPRLDSPVHDDVDVIRVSPVEPSSDIPDADDMKDTREIIDLCLDDTPAKAASANCGPNTIDQTHGVICLSDDFDSSINFDESWEAQQHTKRRRTSARLSSALAINGADKWTTSDTSPKLPALKTQATKVDAHYESSLIATASAGDDMARSGKTRTTVTSLILSSEGSEIFFDYPSRRKRSIDTTRAPALQPPELTNQVSEQTALLLADIRCNDQKSKGRQTVKKWSNGHENGEATDLAARPSSRRVASYSDSIEGQEIHEDISLSSKPLKKKMRCSEAEKLEKSQQMELRKALAKEERQRVKDAKAKEKRIAAELAAVNQARTDKKSSTPEMIVDLHALMEQSDIGASIRGFLANLGVVIDTHNRSPSNTIRWRRKVRARFSDERGHWEPTPETIEDVEHVMCLLPATEFVELASAAASNKDGQDLDAHILHLKSENPSTTPIYLIEGLTAWMRKNKNTRNRAYQAAVMAQPTNGADSAVPSSSTQPRPPGRRKPPPQAYVDEDMIEDALLRLQIIHQCLIHHTTSPVQSAEWVATFTQHISTIPYRNQRMNLETSFCMDVGQVKTGENKEETYIKMLQEIIRVTAPVAYGIAAEYPTLQALVTGLRDKGTTALQDLRVRRPSQAVQKQVNRCERSRKN